MKGLAATGRRPFFLSGASAMIARRTSGEARI